MDSIILTKMQHHTCCFTGHRRLPANRVEPILRRLDDVVERLIKEGVTTFLSGGAIGFDQMAAARIAEKKEMGRAIRLELALPCRDQDRRWTEEQKAVCRRLLECADEVSYISQAYTEGCMRKRNLYMVDRSAYCICALLREASGTGQTVRYAKRRQLCIINVAREINP